MHDEMDLIDVFKGANPGDGGAGSTGAFNEGNSPIKELIVEDDNKNIGGNSVIAATDDDENIAGSDGGEGGNLSSGGDFGNSGTGASTEDMPEMISSLFEAVAESAGIDVDSLPKTPEELIDKLSGIIKDGSKPKYNSPISEEFDAFIGSGGTVEDYVLRYAGSVGFLPSIETEEEKISVVEQVLTDAGFSKEKISKKIEKYLENDTIDEEARDALGVLSEKRNAQLAKKVEEEKRIKVEREKEAVKFFSSVEEEIKKLTHIRGIKLTQEQQKELISYCLKPDKTDGLTGFQRDYAKSPVLNFVESAFFTKYATAALKAAEGAGSSSALEKFKATLKQTKMSGNSQRQSSSGSGSVDQFIKMASAFSGRK